MDWDSACRFRCSTTWSSNIAPTARGPVIWRTCPWPSSAASACLPSWNSCPAGRRRIRRRRPDFIAVGRRLRARDGPPAPLPVTTEDTRAMELASQPAAGPRPLQLETGFERLPNGVLHVACRTDLHNCTGEMFEWWFRSRPGTREYIWWHRGPRVQRLGRRQRRYARGLDPSGEGVLHRHARRRPGHPVSRRRRVLRRRGLPRGARQRRHLGRRLRPRRHGRDAATPAHGRSAGRPPAAHRPRHEMGLALRSHFYMGQDLVADGWTPDQLRRNSATTSAARCSCTATTSSPSCRASCPAFTPATTATPSR